MMLTRESVLKLNNTEMHNGIDFEELPNIPKINLRGDSSDKNFMKNVGAILNTLLPTEANVSDTNDSIRIIWLGPNEWLIQINNENKFKDVLLKLQSTLNPQYTAITDVTESRTIIKAKGANLYKLLAKFMVINLDEVLKKEFAVAQTIFIKIPILIVRNHKNKDEPNIDIHTNRSHTNYLYNLLVDGTRNFDF
jgi:sarcosine oxidase subunit gamma